MRTKYFEKKKKSKNHLKTQIGDVIFYKGYGKRETGVQRGFNCINLRKRLIKFYENFTRILPVVAVMSESRDDMPKLYENKN